MKIQLALAMAVCTMAMFGGAKALGDGQREKESDDGMAADASFRSHDAQGENDNDDSLSEPVYIDVEDARHSKRMTDMRNDHRMNYMAPIRPLHRGRFGKRAVHELSARALGYSNEVIAPVHRGRFGKRQADDSDDKASVHRGRFGKRDAEEDMAPVHRGRFGKRQAQDSDDTAPAHRGRFGKRQAEDADNVAPAHRGRFGKRQAEDSDIVAPAHRGRFGKREMIMGRRTRPFSRARGRFGKRSASPDYTTDYEEAMGAIDSQYADAFSGF